MKPLSVASRAVWNALSTLSGQAAVSAAALIAGGCAAPADQPKPSAETRTAIELASRPGTPLEDVVIRSAPGVKRPPFQFSAEDSQFLDEVQYGAFKYFWEAVTPSGMIPDRSSASYASTAGVGFQLAAFCIGVEHGWITREEGSKRAAAILSTLAANPDNRKAGLFQHFVDGKTAGIYEKSYEHVVSTIDSALLFSGVLTASQYFGGEVRTIGDKLFAEADWKFFILEKARPEEPWAKGYISLGWKPDDIKKPTGNGTVLPYGWIDAGCEHRLVSFLAAAAPNPEYRVDPKVYYHLRRGLGEYADTGPMVWFPYSGSLFASFFSHCWIDYASMGPDDPGAFGEHSRVRTDWWENSRRAVQLHRIKAMENPKHIVGLGEHTWGLTASDKAGGYQVPGLFPTMMPMPGAVPNIDFSTFTPKDDYGDGTIAPYGAGSSIMFEPAAAIAAMRHYSELKNSSGALMAWRDPKKPIAEGGGYGFVDSFNLGTGWVGTDYLAIDQGPLLVAIENARTGLIWRNFSEHPAVQQGMKRLQIVRNR